ncbi:MAG: penicillin-binding transpeptidase domain-containing protein [Cellvibrionales bacterium]
MGGRRRADDPIPAWRLGAVSCALLVLAALLIGRLLFIQGLDQERGASFLQEQGAMRSVRTAEIPAYRGMVTDRRGEPLAISTPVVTLWADPASLVDSGRIADLAAALEVPEASLRERLALYQGKRFMYLARHQTPDVARRILGLKIPGVAGQREYRRFYPAGEVASQVIGLTNVDGEGIAGLELAYNEVLRGRTGQRRYIKDLHGEAIRDIGVVAEAVPGRDIALSLDARLQYFQHRELQRAMVETGAAAGAAVTIDAWTGEILAMTNHPVFNPNSREGFDYAATRNRVVTDAFEPGSTLKPLALVAALETGTFTIDSMIDTSPGRIRVGSKVLPDPLNYGEISLSRVIEKSSQVGVTKVAQSLGHEPILDVYRRFGLGEPSSIGFPGERTGGLPDRQRWSDIEKVTLAFGYGLTATPLQIAHAYTVFANRGRLVPLTLIQRAPDERPVGREVITADVAGEVLTVLERVTGDEGTGKKARVPGFSVGGKTGTVHKVGPNGYLPDQYLALFVGIAPMDNPRYVTAVVVDQPKGDNYGGGSAAAPVYARITEGVLRLTNQRPLAEPQAHTQVAAFGGGG